MLRRRPAAVYEMLAEDELLARAEDPRDSDLQPHDDGLRGYGPEPVGAAPASTLGAPRATARRQLFVALTAAAFIGFAVWELLGIANESVASRAGAAVRASRADVAHPELGRHGSRALGRSTRSPRAVRPAAAAARVPPAAPPVQKPPRSLTTSEPGGPQVSAAPIVSALAPSTPSAEQEFGFER